MCKKLFYTLAAIIFCMATAKSLSQPAMSAPDGFISTNHDGGVEFNYLSKLKTGIEVSWVRKSDYVLAKDANEERRYFWTGTFDAFTFNDVSIVTSKKDGTNLGGVGNNSEIWGRRNGTRWQSSSFEKGIVDINSNPDAQTKAADNFRVYPLTNILTMGFGEHWDVNSMRLSADGKVTGKYKHPPDTLEGLLTYLPNGQIQKCLYKVPSLNESFLLSFSYRADQTNQNQFPSGFTLSQVITLPNGELYVADPLEKCEILDISDQTPEAASLAGVPDPSLYKNALISNGETYASSPRALTPEVLGAIDPDSSQQVSNTEASRPVMVRIIILAIFFPLLIIMAFLTFKKWRSK